MIAKVDVGNSLYGALAYSGERVNKGEGRLLAANRIYNDGMGTVDIRRAMKDLLALMPARLKAGKSAVYISLNLHPDNMLTDTELQGIVREHLEKMGFGNQPCMVYKHKDIDCHHLHTVTVWVDGDSRSIDTRDSSYRSKQIIHELERKHGLYDVGWKSRRTDTPLHKMDVLADDAKEQTGSVVKEPNRRYRLQMMSEYRAFLSLYNMAVEEARGNVRGRKYNGLVYSVTDDSDNKVDNPFKSSPFGKSVDYDVVQRKFARSRTEIKDRKFIDMTKHTVLSVLQGTYDKKRFIATLKGKGIDAMLHYTEERRIHGTTLIDHQTGYVPSDSRMGRGLSASTLQEHSTLPYAEQPSIPLFITTGGQEETQAPSTPEYERDLGCMGLLSPEDPAVGVKEEALIRATQRRKKKKKRKGLGT